jgi:Copper resistance protein D
MRLEIRQRVPEPCPVEVEVLDHGDLEHRRTSRRRGASSPPTLRSRATVTRGLTPDPEHRVLPVSWTTIRIFLHVLGATVWVGGQLTLAGLVPGLRRVSPDAPRAVARRFNVIAWVAFAVLIATGIWNILAIRPDWSSSYGTTLIVKLVVVAASGLTAALHARARSAVPLAVFGALSGLTALTALFLGVLLAG